MIDTVVAPPPVLCRIGELRLYHFRNYAEQTVELAEGINVIGGRNAQGKTNLLEAVATLLLTRSPRASAMSDVLRWGDDEALVSAAVYRDGQPSRLAVRFQREHAEARVARTVTIDDKPRPARDLLGICPVVTFWPEDLQLVKAGPDGRRRLLDVIASQLDRRAAADLLRYRKVLQQRNALLRQLRTGLAPDAQLPSFTAELLDLGARIVVQRTRLVTTLSPQAGVAMDEISAGREQLSLRYLPDGTAPDDDVESVREQLAATLQRRREDELVRGVTLAGPHRDDVEVVIDGRAARGIASQGQQRSAVLAIKLAELRHYAVAGGAAPVLVLDDVLSELDAGRREHLLAALARDASQVLLSSSEAGPLGGGLRASRRFEVNAGRALLVEENAG